MVLCSKDGKKHLYIDCYCGCDSGLRIRVDTLEHSDIYCFLSCTNSSWHTEQIGCWKALTTKLRKIWAIIRNKDYVYSEICLTKQEFEDFKVFLNELA